MTRRPRPSRATRFVRNAQGEAELDGVVAEATFETAELIATRARENAPVASGTYRDSIRAERDGRDAVVVADVPYAVYIEFGTADTPAFAPLTRAVAQSANEVLGIFRRRLPGGR